MRDSATKLGQRLDFGLALVILGVVCVVAPGSWLLTPAHVAFFGVVPREVWGVVHVALGVLLWTQWWRYAARVFIPVALTWAGVALHPITDNTTWNGVSVVAWCLIAAAFWRLSNRPGETP